MSVLNATFRPHSIVIFLLQHAVVIIMSLLPFYADAAFRPPHPTQSHCVPRSQAPLSASAFIRPRGYAWDSCSRSRVANAGRECHPQPPFAALRILLQQRALSALLQSLALAPPPSNNLPCSPHRPQPCSRTPPLPHHLPHPGAPHVLSGSPMDRSVHQRMDRSIVRCRPHLRMQGREAPGCRGSGPAVLPHGAI